MITIVLKRWHWILFAVLWGTEFIGWWGERNGAPFEYMQQCARKVLDTGRHLSEKRCYNSCVPRFKLQHLICRAGTRVLGSLH